MTSMTYADVLRPTTQRSALMYDAALILVGSLFIALSAQIAIYLPYSPVPVTGQTLAVLLIGALFGSKRGTATVLAYLAEGASGLPVFAGGQMGTAYMSGPTGGYLAGFVIAVFAVGWLAERGWDRRIVTTALAMVIGNGLIYVCGVYWLSTFLGLKGAIAGGLEPFIVGDVAKIILAMLLLPGGWRLIERTRV